MAPEQPKLIETTLDAYVHRVIFTHPETGFTILSTKSGPSNQRVVVLGELYDVRPGQTARFYGQFVVSKKHGRQFRAERWEEIRPETREGLIRYLSGQFKGIGPKLAERIVDSLGPSTLDIIEDDPGQLRQVPGIGSNKFRVIMGEWKGKRALAEATLFLSTLKVGPATAHKIIREYGFNTEGLIRDDPYRLAREIRGIGFASADEIAARLDIRGDDARRLRAGVAFELDQAKDNGHTCLPRKELIRRCVVLLEQPGKIISDAIDTARKTGDLLFRKVSETDSRIKDDLMVFQKNLDWLEQNLADNVRRLCGARVPRIAVDIGAVYAAETRRTGLRADPIQRDALDLLQNCPVFVITGGPGTGKTTLVRIMLKVLRGLQIKLAAPTGRAAQRLTETSGMEAATLHRLLEFVPQTGMFNRNAKRPLNADVVVADESSMMDTPLAAALLRGLKKGTRLIFVGDVDQLPSVGPGRVLADLIDSGVLPVVRLQQIFRQSGDSQIVMNAHRIIGGQVPILDHQAADIPDFVFIEKDDPEAAVEVVKRLPGRIARRLGIDPVSDIQVLSPMHRGDLGVQNLNEILRDTLNPHGTPVIGPGGYRVGDKVMQIRNNYDLEVFNGDVGRILGVDDKDRIWIAFSDRKIAYSMEMMEQVTAAFACSIHKSQGSEYPAVIIPVHTQHYVMLRRQLLYTAVTRGKRMVVLVGSKKALGIAVKNSHEDSRYTLLKQRLRQA